MKRTRPLLILSTVLPTVAVGAVGYWLAAKTSPDAAFSRIWLDVGLVVYLIAAVTALTQGPAQLVRRLSEAMRGLSIGQRDQRLEPDRFGDLGDLARAFNEVAAALSERDDPNVGRINSRKRTARELSSKAEAETTLVSSTEPKMLEAKTIEPKSGDGPRQGQKEGPAGSRSSPSSTDGDAVDAGDPNLGPGRKISKVAVDSDSDSNSDSDASGSHDAPAQAERENESDIGRVDDVDNGGDAGEDGQLESAEAEADTGGRKEQLAVHDAKTITPEERSPAEGQGSPSEDESPEDESSEDERADFQAPTDDEDFSPPESLVAKSDLDASFAGENNDEDENNDEATSSEGKPTEGATVPDAPAPDPLAQLFTDYVQAKIDHGEDTDDLELYSFMDTIREECLRLQETHQCRDVRFEVRVQGGEVSLLPRLLR